MFYIYDVNTKLFSHETEGQKDPLGGGVLTPASSTTTKPPIMDGLVARFNITSGEWDMIPDHRDDTVFLKSDGSVVELELGDRLDETMTLLEPPNEFPEWKTNGWGQDETKVLEKAKDEKLKVIQDDFKTAESIPVEHGGSQFVGGQESASSIDQYVRLMKIAGATEFKIWDVNGDEHIFDSAGADALLLAIGSASSVNQFAKKNRKVALAKATTVGEVDAV